MGDTLRFSSRLQRWGLYCLTSSVNKAVIYLWLLNQKKKIPKSVLLRHTKQPSTRIFIWNQRRSSLSAPVTSLTSVDSFGKNPLKSGAVSERFCPLRSPFSRLGTSELLPSLWIYLHCRISSRCFRCSTSRFRNSSSCFHALAQRFFAEVCQCRQSEIRTFVSSKVRIS